MATFLSRAWIDGLAAALGSAAPVAGDRLLLGQIVTGAPSGEVRYTLAVGGGEPPEVVEGTTEGATVTLVADYATARAIASGTPAAELLSQGRVKVRGDANALIAAEEQLAVIGGALAGLAAATEF